jgi:YD repeat-containing protein
MNRLSPFSAERFGSSNSATLFERLIFSALLAAAMVASATPNVSAQGVPIEGISLTAAATSTTPALAVNGHYTLEVESPTEILITLQASGFGSNYANTQFASNIAAEYDVGIYSASINYVPNAYGIQGDGGVPWVPPFFGENSALGVCTEFSNVNGTSTNETTQRNAFITTGTVGEGINIIEMGYFWVIPGVQAFQGASLFQAHIVPYVFGTPPFTQVTTTGLPRTENVLNQTGDPVDVTTGEFYQNTVDLHVNAPLPIEIRRVYSTMNNSINDLGYGWLTGYTSYLTFNKQYYYDDPGPGPYPPGTSLSSSPPIPDGSIFTATDSDGSVVIFRSLTSTGEGPVWLPRIADNPNLSNSAGGRSNLLNSILVQTSSGGSPQTLEWHLADGTVRRYTTISSNLGSIPQLVQIEDSRGNTLNFSYGTDSTQGNYGKMTLIQSSNGSSVALGYNSLGLLVQATSSDGRTVSYSYSYSGKLTGVTLPDGGTYSYQYALGTNDITQITKPDGRGLKVLYDSNFRVAQQQATIGPNLGYAVTNSYGYSVPGQTVVGDALGNDTVYKYSGSLITSITDPLGHTITQNWYTSANPATGAYWNSLQSVTDKRGLVTAYNYDALGNIVQTTITGNLIGDNGSESVSTAATFQNLQVLLATEGNNYYSNDIVPATTTDASGITTTFAYADPNYPDLPTQVSTSKSGSQIRNDLLSYTEVTDLSNPANPVSSGLLAEKIVASGSADQSTTQYGYNGEGFLEQLTSLTGTNDPNVVTTFTYDAAGELSSTTDADGRSTSYTYDGMSRPTGKVVRDESGNVLGSWTTTYDGSGDVVEVDGPRSSPTNTNKWVYDGGGRLLEESTSHLQANPNGAGVALGSTPSSTGYVHDNFGNLTSQTDSMGNVTAFTYDANEQMLTKATAGLRLEAFQYESGGNVSSYTNPLGGVTARSYTGTGQLSSQQNPDGSTLQWAYYTDGRIQKEVLRNGSFWLTTYDDVNRVVTRTLTQSGGTVLAVETNSFDRKGNLISHTDVDGFVSTTNYDGLNRVKTSTGPAAVSGSSQQSVTMAYGASSKSLTSQNALGELTVTISDALGRPQQVTIEDAGGNALRVKGFTYIAGNNGVIETDGTGASAISRTVYTDAASRPLMTVLGDNSTSTNAYDLDGNLISKIDALGQTTAFAYNGLNVSDNSSTA